MSQALKTGLKARKFLSVFPKYSNSHPPFSTAESAGAVLEEMTLKKEVRA
jgi:hypothetical protein